MKPSFLPPPAAALALAAALLPVPMLAQTDAASAFPPPMSAGPASGPAKGARYVIDPTHTFVNYEIGHYGTTTNRGRFSTKDGTVQVDASGTGGKVDITMDMSSINTGVDLLNRHVQSKDFLNIAEYPTSRFVADKLLFQGDKVAEVDGSLTLLGQTRPVKLRANRFNCYQNPLLKRQVCGGDFEAVIQRSEWGVTWGLNFGFEDKMRLLVQVEAVNIQP